MEPKSGTERADSGLNETVAVQRVRIPAPLLHQLEEILAEPALGFQSLEHVILAGLWSFASYKRRQIAALRRDSEPARRDRP